MAGQLPAQSIQKPRAATHPGTTAHFKPVGHEFITAQQSRDNLRGQPEADQGSSGSGNGGSGGGGQAIDPSHWCDPNNFLVGGLCQATQATGQAVVAGAQANLMFAQSLQKIAKMLPIVFVILVIAFAISFSKR